MTLMPMWRKHQLLPFTLLTLVVGVLLTLSMIALAYVLFLGLFAQAFSRSMLAVLAGLVVVTSVLILLALVQLGYVSRTVQRDRHHDRRVAHWHTRLRAVMDGQALQDPASLDDLGADTLLMLREEAGDTPAGERLAELYERAGRRARDEALVQSSAHPNVRAFALERLALLRSPHSLDLMLRLTREGRPSLRNLALLAATQILADRHGDPLTLCPILTSGEFTMQQGREVLTLLGDRAGPLVRALSEHPNPAARELAGDSAAYSTPALYADVARRLLYDPVPDVRASALRLYAAGAALDPVDAAQVQVLASAPEWFVRAQAALALGRLTPLPDELLWTLLADPAWWVRRNAARLLRDQPGGAGLLKLAADTHPDRFARDMASATLQLAPQVIQNQPLPSREPEPA